MTREVFDNLDVNQNGTLSKEEFLDILEKITPGVTISNVDKQFKKAKIDGEEMDVEGFFRCVTTQMIHHIMIQYEIHL